VTIKPAPVPKKPVTGSIFIQTEPDLAKIWIDDGYEGQSPLEILNLSPGLIVVKVGKAGYQSQQEKVHIRAGRRSELTLLLPENVPLPGRLTVSVNPVDALITLLNTKKVYRNGMELAAGTYKVEVSKKGYVTSVQSVDVAAGKDVDVLIVLEKNSGHIGKLALLFQQADRQIKEYKLTAPPGDNAVETLRQVLSIDPDEPQFYRRMNEVVNAFCRLGEKEARKKKYEKAVQLYGQGKTIAQKFHLSGQVLDSLDQRIGELEKQADLVQRKPEKPQEPKPIEKKPPVLKKPGTIIKRITADKQKELERIRRLARLFQQADRQIKEYKLTTPPGNNAIETLRQVLSIDPDELQFNRRMNEVVNAYCGLGEKEARKRQFEKAVKRYQQGKAIAQEFHLSRQVIDSLDQRIMEIKKQAEQELRNPVKPQVPVKPVTPWEPEKGGENTKPVKKPPEKIVKVPGPSGGIIIPVKKQKPRRLRPTGVF
jgi:tetratricopeptide (TPR) repeat protein